VRVTGTDGAPSLKCDAQDQCRDGEADDGVGARDPDGHRARGNDDAERHEPVNAGVLTVGDERRAVDAPPASQPHTSRELVSRETNHARERQRPEMIKMLGMNESPDRFDAGDRRGDEDRADDGVARPPFSPCAPDDEGKRKRNRGQCIAGVVNEVRKERNRCRCQKHDGLEEGGCREDRQAQRDRTHAGTRSNNCGIDQSVRVLVGFVNVVGLRRRTEGEPSVPVRPVMVVPVSPQAVPVFQCPVHVATLGRATLDGGPATDEVRHERQPTSRPRCLGSVGIMRGSADET
jgi:hypothetical protein